MNVHPYYFRTPIRNEFSQEDFERFIYFEKIYGGIGGIRPNTVPYINYERTVADDSKTIAITYRDDGLVHLNWVRVSYLQPDHPEAHQAFETVVHRLTEKAPTYPLAEVQQLYRDAPPEEDGQRLFAVYATAVAAPWAFDPAYFEAMGEYARDAKATVRAGVVIGIGYIGLTEYTPVMEQLTEDESADVHQRAQAMLDSFAEAQTLLRGERA